MIKIIVFILPFIAIYLSSFKCNIGKNSGKNIKARPPSWVFGVVWALLTVSLGMTWVNLTNKSILINILMVLNLIGLSTWTILYGCYKNKKGALYVLLYIFTISLMIFGYAWSVDNVSGILITPYLAWITFAMLLNFTQVNNIIDN